MCVVIITSITEQENHNWAFRQPQLRRNVLSPLQACLPPKFVRGWVTNQSMASVFCEAITKKMNKKFACIIACLILLVLSLAHYVIFPVFFPGIELRFFLVSLRRKNREIKNPSSDKHCKAVSGASWSSEVTNYFVTTGCKIEDEVNFCCFCFVLYLSYSHGKATVAVCFGCIQNLYHNKSVFVAQIDYSD